MECAQVEVLEFALIGITAILVKIVSMERVRVEVLEFALIGITATLVKAVSMERVRVEVVEFALSGITATLVKVASQAAVQVENDSLPLAFFEHAYKTKIFLTTVEYQLLDTNERHARGDFMKKLLIGLLVLGSVSSFGSAVTLETDPYLSLPLQTTLAFEKEFEIPVKNYTYVQNGEIFEEYAEMNSEEAYCVLSVFKGGEAEVPLFRDVIVKTGRELSLTRKTDSSNGFYSQIKPIALVFNSTNNNELYIRCKNSKANIAEFRAVFDGLAELKISKALDI